MNLTYVSNGNFYLMGVFRLFSVRSIVVHPPLRFVLRFVLKKFYFSLLFPLNVEKNLQYLQRHVIFKKTRRALNWKSLYGPLSTENEEKV